MFFNNRALQGTLSSFFWDHIICFSFSLVHFKNVSEYLTRGIVLVFSPLMRSLQLSLILRSLLGRLRYFSIIIFSLVSAYSMESTSNKSKFAVILLFSKRSDSVSNLAVLFFPLFVYFHSSLSAWSIFKVILQSYILSVGQFFFVRE